MRNQFTVNECNDLTVIRELFLEYSQIKGAESCFVSFENEISNLKAFYSGGALLAGYENEKPVGCIAVKKLDEMTCEAKRLFIKPEARGKGYGRMMMSAMLAKALELGYQKVFLTTKPAVMKIGYELYKNMGFIELSENQGTVKMEKDI